MHLLKFKMMFIAPLRTMPFSCFGKKRAKRSRHKGHCASRSRAPNPSPCVSPAALTTPRSTLTYILSTTKMFRFLPCRGSVSGIRQGGESGAAAISKVVTRCCHVVRTSRGFFGACGWGTQGRTQFVARQRGMSASPVPPSLVTFLCGNKKVIPIDESCNRTIN